MTAESQPDSRALLITARLSQPRLQPYLAATNGNHREALRLYRWNIELSGAAYEALHVFEVVLRNAMDAQLCAWNATQTERGTGRRHSPDWLLDPSHLLQRLTGDDLLKATKRASRALRPARRQAGHADILAQLSFGTWRFLLPDRDRGRQRLWADAVAKAFPHWTGTPRDLVTEVDSIYRLRNRVAHLEPLLRPGTTRREVNSMRHVLAAIDPVIEEWFVSAQKITSTLRARPVSEPAPLGR